MRQVLLILVITSSALDATSVASSSCTAGTTTESPCPGTPLGTGGLSGPNYSATAYACAGPSCAAVGLSGISAYATASAGYTAPPPPPLPAVSASANASDSFEYYTTGPSRPGFIEFTLAASILTSHGGYGDVNITDGVHTYHAGAGAPVGKCGGLGCGLYTATLPFDLGTDFQIVAFASGSVSVTPSGTSLGYGQGGEAEVTSFSLFEANGTTPVPFSLVPEPSTWGLLIIGLSAGTWLVRRRFVRAES